VKTILRTGSDAEAYSDALAAGTCDPKRSDVFSKIRKDLDAAGMAQPDEEILRVMTGLTLKAGNRTSVARKDFIDDVCLCRCRSCSRCSEDWPRANASDFRGYADKKRESYKKCSFYWHIGRLSLGFARRGRASISV